MQADILRYFANYIEKEVGIVFSEDNFFQLQNRLEEVCQYYRFKDMQELFMLAQSKMSPELRTLILDSATNNETYFFRDPKIFEALENLLTGLICRAQPPGEIRVWSAASSTGQEALSIAILSQMVLNKFGSKAKVSILGTDVNGRVIARAKKGLYSHLEVQRGLTAAQLLLHFDKCNDNEWQVKRNILDYVTYMERNLHGTLEELGEFDFVFCRNMLIYQRIENKKRILKMLSRRLKPEGRLILGAGESMIGLTDDFEQEIIQGCPVYKLKTQALKKTA